MIVKTIRKLLGLNRHTAEIERIEEAAKQADLEEGAYPPDSIH